MTCRRDWLCGHQQRRAAHQPVGAQRQYAHKNHGKVERKPIPCRAKALITASTAPASPAYCRWPPTAGRKTLGPPRHHRARSSRNVRPLSLRCGHCRARTRTRSDAASANLASRRPSRPLDASQAPGLEGSVQQRDVCLRCRSEHALFPTRPVERAGAWSPCPVITAGVMPARCSSLRPCPSSVLKRLNVSPDSLKCKPPSVRTPSTSKNATRMPCAFSSNSGGKFRAGAAIRSPWLASNRCC